MLGFIGRKQVYTTNYGLTRIRRLEPYRRNSHDLSWYQNKGQETHIGNAGRHYNAWDTELPETRREGRGRGSARGSARGRRKIISKEFMVVHKYFVLREGRDIAHASMPPLVVFGQPLCNLVWREARKTTARTYRLRMILLQATHKIVK